MKIRLNKRLILKLIILKIILNIIVLAIVLNKIDIKTMMQNFLIKISGSEPLFCFI